MQMNYAVVHQFEIAPAIILDISSVSSVSGSENYHPEPLPSPPLGKGEGTVHSLRSLIPPPFFRGRLGGGRSNCTPITAKKQKSQWGKKSISSMDFKLMHYQLCL